MIYPSYHLLPHTCYFSSYQYWYAYCCVFFFFFQAEDGIRDPLVTGVQTCALPILDALQGPLGDDDRDLRDPLGLPLFEEQLLRRQCGRGHIHPLGLGMPPILAA